MLKDAGAAILVCEQATEGKFLSTGAVIACVDRDSDRIASHRDENLDVAVFPEILLSVIRERGSRGLPLTDVYRQLEQSFPLCVLDSQ
jgi:hypothetical protein